MATKSEAMVAETARRLEADLQRARTGRWKRVIATVVVIGGLGGGAYYLVQSSQPPPESPFSTKAVERRDIVEEIQSTGRVKPLKEVEVGAQVSGRIVDVHVDFNSKVEEGDLLAEIDPSLFGAQVSQTTAQLGAAKASAERAAANLATAQTNLDRTERLVKDQLASAAELDQARGARDIARADLAAARAQINQLRAQLTSARTTLDYTKIYSPISGVVVERAVDPGQTVAASFSAPKLFVIAQDLSKMQVLADIDEADVGKLNEGMAADVAVDAFLGKKFAGRVTQVRYSPNEVQGVVTYSAVVDVENPELLLRPGMTATVTIETHRAKDVPAVPNSALRFSPAPLSDDEDAPQVPKPSRALEHGEGRVYTLPADASPEALPTEVVVSIGKTDGIWTELTGGPLKVGDLVVVEQRAGSKRRKFLGVF